MKKHKQRARKNTTIDENGIRPHHPIQHARESSVTMADVFDIVLKIMGFTVAVVTATIGVIALLIALFQNLLL